MDKKIISTSTGTIVLVIIVITTGLFVWIYEKGQNQEAVSMQTQTIPKKVASDEKKNSDAEIIGTDPVEKWKTYENQELHIKMKYPSKLFISTKNGKIFFEPSSPTDPAQKQEGIILTKLQLSLDQRTVSEIANERKSAGLVNFQENSIQINRVTAQKISYTDAFAGGTFYEILIPTGIKTLYVWYSDENQTKTIYEKMLQTLEFTGK